jgi:hypothetical protein
MHSHNIIFSTYHEHTYYISQCNQQFLCGNRSTTFVLFLSLGMSPSIKVTKNTSPIRSMQFPECYFGSWNVFCQPWGPIRPARWGTVSVRTIIMSWSQHLTIQTSHLLYSVERNMPLAWWRCWRISRSYFHRLDIMSHDGRTLGESCILTCGYCFILWYKS